MGHDTKHKKLRYKINTLDKCLRLLVEAIKRGIKKIRFHETQFGNR